jgi:phosphatidylinositol alpha-1,6-mannosyltransferase
MPHLLVTNDFPPKVGGIQTYLWELWRRLPNDGGHEVHVLTTAHPDSARFDRAQPFHVERTREKVLLPTPALARRIDCMADAVQAKVVILDPALPLGLVGPRLSRPYALVLHGSELVGRVPGGSQLMGAVVRGAVHVIAAGGYPASEARRVAGGDGRTPPVTVIPPGIDLERFTPDATEPRAEARRRLLGADVDDGALVVVGVSRLVPRKGFDRLVEAAAELQPRHPDLLVAIGGEGRDRTRLQRLIDRTGAPAVLLGRVGDDDLPALYRSADVFAMACRTRWLGLEPEGFGIVFVEAAACGVPQVAGDSGGAADAVVDGVTGVVVRRPRDARAVALALGALLADPQLRAAMGRAGVERARRELAYDHLAARLADTLSALP